MSPADKPPIAQGASVGDIVSCVLPVTVAPPGSGRASCGKWLPAAGLTLRALPLLSGLLLGAQGARLGGGGMLPLGAPPAVAAHGADVLACIVAAGGRAEVPGGSQAAP